MCCNGWGHFLERDRIQNDKRARPCGKEAQRAIAIPAHLIDFHIVGALLDNLGILGIDERNHIVLVTDCQSLSIGAPSNVDVFSFRVNLVGTLARRSCIPNTDSFVW